MLPVEKGGVAAVRLHAFYRALGVLQCFEWFRARTGERDPDARTQKHFVTGDVDFPAEGVMQARAERLGDGSIDFLDRHDSERFGAKPPRDCLARKQLPQAVRDETREEIAAVGPNALADAIDAIDVDYNRGEVAALLDDPATEPAHDAEEGVSIE